MGTVQLGPLTIHTNKVGWQPTVASAFVQGKAKGVSYPATVTGPDGFELDLAIFMSDEGEGMVHCPDSSGVPADYARLAHGARLGVYAHDQGDWVIKQLRLLRFSLTSGWGNPNMTDIEELDNVLGASVEALFLGLGLGAIGPKHEILGSKGNDLAMRWNSNTGPDLPLAAYSLTRILPIYKALGR